MSLARLGQDGLVAKASSIEGLKGQVANLALVAGSKGRLVFDGLGLGIAADWPGVELYWRHKLTDVGIVVDDVKGEGLSTAIVEFHVPVIASQGQPSMSIVPGLVVVLGVVAVVLLALGWLIKEIRLFLDPGLGILKHR